MRIVFMGTPEFAVPALRALVAAGHEIACVYTQPPRPGGRRGRELTPSPVQREAAARGIPVRCPVSLKMADAQAEFAMWDADIAVVAAYGLILPQRVLDAPRMGCLNLHASLLPRWRGAAPVQRAILAGDAQTGVCIMRMKAGLDTGAVLARGCTEIALKSAGALTSELAAIGAALIVAVLADIRGYREIDQPDDGVTYATKIDKSEARIDFARDADAVARQVQAFAPAPGAWLKLGGERVKVLAAEVIDAAGAVGTVIDDRLTIACACRAVRPTLVQRAGRPVMKGEDFLRGFTVPLGAVIEGG